MRQSIWHTNSKIMISQIMIPPFVTTTVLNALAEFFGKSIGGKVKTFIDVLMSGKKDKNGVLQAELDPIYITLVAPRGAGKTSLLATVITYIEKHLRKADGFSVRPCSELDGTRISKFNDDLYAKMSAKSFKFDSGFLKGDNEITKFDFEINYNIEGVEINLKQKFVVMDIPGGWISDNIPFPAEFTEHFHKSRILWIPVEAPALMEVDENAASERGHAANVLCCNRVGDFIKEWAEERKNKKPDEPCSANFVITKCETYHTQDETKDKHRWSECRLRFNQKYDDIISEVHKTNGNVKMTYIPVETIGFVKIIRHKWVEEEGRSVLKADYKFTDSKTNPEISGVDALMSTVLEYWYTNLDTRIKNDIKALDQAIEDAWFSSKEKKMKADLEDFHKKLEPLQHKILELKVPSPFSKKYSTPV